MLGLGQLLGKPVGGMCARYKYPKRRCTRLLMQILGLPDNQYLTRDRGLELECDEKARTKVHDMVAADGTIVDHDVCVCVRLI